MLLLRQWHKPDRLTGHLESGSVVACIDLVLAQIQVNKCFLSKSSFLYAYEIKITCNSCICRPVRCRLNRGHHDTNSRILWASQGPSPCPALCSSLSNEDLWAAMKCPLTSVSSPLCSRVQPQLLTPGVPKQTIQVQGSLHTSAQRGAVLDGTGWGRGYFIHYTCPFVMWDFI